MKKAFSNCKIIQFFRGNNIVFKKYKSTLVYLLYWGSGTSWYFAGNSQMIFFFSVFYHFKHEYLRSRAYICLSLSSSSDDSDISSNFTHINHLIHHGLSRYSCLHLGSLHPRIFRENNDTLTVAGRPFSCFLQNKGYL